MQTGSHSSIGSLIDRGALRRYGLKKYASSPEASVPLTKCPRCKNDIIDKTQPCPDCGHRFRPWLPPMNRRHALLGAVLMVGMGLFVYVEGDRGSVIPYVVLCGVMLLMAKHLDS